MAGGQNKHADSLVTLASTMTEDVPRIIKVKLITEPSINIVIDVGVAWIGVIMVSTIGPCWMDSIIDFLVEDRISDDEKEASKVHRIAPQYWLSTDRKLYQRSFRRPYLLCLHPGKVNELLTELQERVYGSHVGGRSLAHRAMTQGFWWPQMHKDAIEYVRKCERCQKYAPLTHQLAGDLNPISNP